MGSSQWRSFTTFRSYQSASFDLHPNRPRTGKLLTFLSQARCAVCQPSGQAQFCPHCILSSICGFRDAGRRSFTYSLMMMMIIIIITTTISATALSGLWLPLAGFVIIYILRGGVVKPTPNSLPGEPGYRFLSLVITFDLLARKALPVATLPPA